ncbi:MAG: 30S ribosomal protein S2 [SAR202 cluster bacterium Io17-Chloro-G4]|nr:MAG: 30S ribosomal protein S2 [SAR202 cluster bacterium Io17-Chloro-G4]
MVQSLEQPAEPQPAPVLEPEIGEETEQEVAPRPAPVREPLTMKSLLEAGVHFGHQTRRWNPRMKRYIFTQRNGIHIIDLQQTLGMINDAYKAMTQVVADGGKVLFVGTKRQAQEVISSEAERCGMWYVNQRWLGGTLTNFQTIRSRINYMLELQQKRDQGYFRLLPKKEGVKLRDTLNRLEKYFHGLRDMGEIPAAMFVVDIGKEDICIAEAQRMGVKIFAIVDSDCNPDSVNQIIPGNDDAVRSIRLITARMATAILEGTAEREARLQAEREELGLDDLPEDESEETELADLGDQPLPPTLEGLEQEFQAAADAEGGDSGEVDGTVATTMVVDAPVDATSEAEVSEEPLAEQPVAEDEKADDEPADQDDYQDSDEDNDEG